MTPTVATSVVSDLRSLFPSLSSVSPNGRPSIFLDNPGGTQVPHAVIQAIIDYLGSSNANTGGPFATSQRTDAMMMSARQAGADFLNASSPSEIMFGANMTTLAFSLSRAIGRTLQAGDEIVTTVLDHEANIAPWSAMAQERGAIHKRVDLRPSDCTLDMEQLESMITSRTRLVAIGYASNATGTINDVRHAIRLAHAVGALVFVDAVQFAPHGLIDVQELDCDFLACSAYKFFGPHVGLLFSKRTVLESLPVDKVRPQKDEAPYRFETGTLNHEGIAGTAAAIDYLASVGALVSPQGRAMDRRSALEAAFSWIRAHEMGLFDRLLTGVEQLTGVRVWGITDRSNFSQRGPTLCFTWPAMTPAATAAWLGHEGVYVWDGDYYATTLMERLGLAPDGAIRLGLAHYNTDDEVDRVVQLLGDAARGNGSG
jgi:cysteine desulfurase family protein (TIGR01976 family)